MNPFKQLFRWRAIVPLALLVTLLVAGWLLLLDTLVARGVEQAGARIVGARVDVAAADVRVGEGAVTLRGLQVANPDAPMTNLIEADEIVADLLVAPLLEKKVVVETLAVRGVRFGTPRETSGALERRSPATGGAYREVSAWAAQVRIPPFSLEGLARTAVSLDAVSPDSLRTVRLARQVVEGADALDSRMDRRLAALDPTTRIDSARALAERLRAADPVRLGPTGVARLAGSARSTLSAVTQLRTDLTALDSTARAGLDEITTQVGRLAAARQEDYAYARGLIRLPSLTGPDLSPALFGPAAVEWVKPVLYWARVAEEYLPPGLRPSRYAGPPRARSSGTTVLFPEREAYPKFLLEHGELDLVLGGAGIAAGAYAARISGLTSDPALYGKPLEIAAGRAAAAGGSGPSAVSVRAMLDHVDRPLRDSLVVYLRGVALPTLDVRPLGARLALGRGATDLVFARDGDRIRARWVWETGNASWERLTGETAGSGEGETGDVGSDGAVSDRDGGLGDPVQVAAPQIGSRAWADDFLWRTVSGIRGVRIELGLSGTLARPSLAISSNVADVVAESLRRELGQELERAERQVRAEVDRLVTAQADAARARAAGLREQVETRVAEPLAEAQRVEAELEAQVRRVTGGIRIP